MLGAALFGAGSIYVYRSWTTDSSNNSTKVGQGHGDNVTPPMESGVSPPMQEGPVTILGDEDIEEKEEVLTSGASEDKKEHLNVHLEPQEEEKAQELSIMASEEETSGQEASESAPTEKKENEVAALEEKTDTASESVSVEDSADSVSATESDVDPAQAEIPANLLQDVLSGKVVQDLERVLESEPEAAQEIQETPVPPPAIVESRSEMRENDTNQASAGLKEPETSSEEAATTTTQASVVPEVKDKLDIESSQEPEVSYDAKVEQQQEKTAEESDVSKSLGRLDETSSAIVEEEKPISVEASTETERVAKETLDYGQIQERIESQKLVAEAIAKGEDPGDNWELYGAMHRQAAHDADVFNSILGSMIKQYEVRIFAIE